MDFEGLWIVMISSGREYCAQWFGEENEDGVKGLGRGVGRSEVDEHCEIHHNVQKLFVLGLN